MNKLTTVVISLGAGLFVFGLLGLTATGGDAIGWVRVDLTSRLIAAFGVGMAAAGMLSRKSSE
jgi:hypothetical protein